MITYRSSMIDVQKECADIRSTLLKRTYGIDIKFKKWRKNNKSTEPTILQRCTYNINNNKVIVWWWGHRVGSCNFIDFTYLVETTNKDGSLRYIFRDSNGSVLEFTSHFLKRLRERLDMSILDLFEQNILLFHTCFTRDDVDGNNAVLCINGIYIMAVKNSDNYYTVTTTINKQQERENQTEHITDMNNSTMAYVLEQQAEQDMLFRDINYSEYNKRFMSKKTNVARFL